MTSYRSLESTRKSIEKLGFSSTDSYGLPTSPLRFPDGGSYRIEVPGVERPKQFEILIDEAEKRGVPVHRVIGVLMGSTLLDDKELAEYARLAHEASIEVILSPGPRTAWDNGRMFASQEGVMSGARYRGMDKLVEVVADIRRGIDLGFRGFLVTDEALLWLLKRLQEVDEIPKDIVFKASIIMGHASPIGGKLLQDLGANSFNPVADLSLPQLAGIRKAITIPLDVLCMFFQSWGGCNRFYETPEITRCAQPVYFKFEPGPNLAMYTPWASADMGNELLREKVKYAEIVINLIRDNYGEAKLSGKGPGDLAVPKP